MDRAGRRRLALIGATALIALSGSLGVACGEDGAPAPHADPPYVPPPESCDAPRLDQPTTFASCTTGGGVFGAWTVGSDGLPAYDYGLDENADDRARWTDSLDQDRREHWASFGNMRVTALASNDGWIEVSTQDRGMTVLDKVEESAGAFGGGLGWIDDGEAIWSTAYKWRPRGSKTTRRFGSAWAEATMLHRDLFASRRTVAPDGDATYVVSEVTLENRGSRPKTLRHYEYWDVRRRPIETQWLVSGKPFAAAPGNTANERDGRNAMFDERVAWDPAARILGVRRSHAPGVTPPPREEPNAVDYFPGDPFLAVLAGEASDVYTDDARFFGDGGPARPAAVASRAPGEIAAIDGAPRSGLGQGRSFVVRSDVTLAPGEKKVLRFAYGYAAMGAPWPDVTPYADLARDPFAERAAALAKHLFVFAPERDPFLHREMAWHAAQLEASVGYREYWDRHVVPQGSAYLYLHGADGALRDTALFALPLVYTHPALAREQLELAMGLSFGKEGRFSYAFQGHGMLDDALGLHSRPSDLDLFFLLAMHEYVGATGDVAFLDAKIASYPRTPDNEQTVLEHLRRHVTHLLDGVGFGEHGLVHIGTGDWSDGIVIGSGMRDLAMEKGESVPNSQMALSILPGIASLLDGRDDVLAKRIRDELPALAAAVDATWTGKFYGRAYFGDGVLRGGDAIDLEAQVWPLVGALAPDKLGPLAAEVAAELDDSSPIGAPLVKGGQVWPAIAQLLTWGYTRVDDERAWRHLAKASLASRARAFPTVWFDVWSGPDGTNSTDGLTWLSPVTPMTDFPTQNANVHAMAIFAALRVAGVEARYDGVVVTPHVPQGGLALRTEVIDLDVAQDRMRITWRPSPGVARTLSVGAPRGATLRDVRLGGAAQTVPPGAKRFDVPIVATGPEGVAVEATFARP